MSERIIPDILKERQAIWSQLSSEYATRKKSEQKLLRIYYRAQWHARCGNVDSARKMLQGNTELEVFEDREPEVFRTIDEIVRGDSNRDKSEMPWKKRKAPLSQRASGYL